MLRTLVEPGGEESEELFVCLVFLFKFNGFEAIAISQILYFIRAENAFAFYLELFDVLLKFCLVGCKYCCYPVFLYLLLKLDSYCSKFSYGFISDLVDTRSA